MTDITISPAPGSSATPDGPPGRKPWYRRRWVKVTGAITGASLIAIVAFAAGHRGTPAAATAPAKPAMTAPATPKATTPARPTAPPASPAPARPQTLLQASGSGN